MENAAGSPLSTAPSGTIATQMDKSEDRGAIFVPTNNNWTNDDKDSGHNDELDVFVLFKLIEFDNSVANNGTTASDTATNADNVTASATDRGATNADADTATRMDTITTTAENGPKAMNLNKKENSNDKDKTTVAADTNDLYALLNATKARLSATRQKYPGSKDGSIDNDDNPYFADNNDNDNDNDCNNSSNTGRDDANYSRKMNRKVSKK